MLRTTLGVTIRRLNGAPVFCTLANMLMIKRILRAGLVSTGELVNSRSVQRCNIILAKNGLYDF